MGILLAVLSGFALALVVPWLHRRETVATGWAVAALPLGLTVYFAGWIPRVASEGAVRIAYAWVPGLDVEFSFLVDGLSLFFALLVCSVGAAIFAYSSAYIEEHPHGGRFYGYLLFFMASMLGLVLADNVFLLYVFFELTSIASFLLIGFEHGDEKARRAAWQALLVTTAGGIALLAAVLLLGATAGTYELSRMEGAQNAALYVPILLLVLLAAFTKSAQFPFYFWLPNAMEAPSPVSAYLHSATMVKAGIYVLARFSPMLGGTDLWTAVVTATGAVTMLLAAFLALRYANLKRLLAYSTVMALGLLTMLLGVGSEAAVLGCMAFIVVHALYKATLFLVVGTLDHQAGSYHLGDLGGLGKALPFTFGAAAAAALSMAGLPPFVGFVGKETVFKALLDVDAPQLVPYILTAAAVLAKAALVAAAAVVAVRPFTGTRRGGEVESAPFSLRFSPVVLAAAGLLAGLAPGFVSRHLVEPAAGAVLRQSTSEHLELWHGVTPELGLSAVTLGLGVGLYAVWGRLHESAGMRAYARWLGDGLDRAYHGVLGAMTALAVWQTRHLQNGVLRHYVAVTFGMGVLLIGATLIRSGSVSLPAAPGEVALYELAVASLVVVAAVAVVAVRHRFTAVLSLSAGGFGIALLYVLFGAPDAAMVQLIIETLTLILVVLALIDMPKVYREPERDRFRHRNLAIAVGAGGVVTLLMLAILQLPFDTTVGDYYAANSFREAHGRNVVNVVLVDFRALDTLGEITVLVIAGLSAYVLVGGGMIASGDEEDGGEPIIIHSLILRTATRLVVPLILLFSIYLLTWGHHSPGGGFSGGLLAALAFSLYAFAYGVHEARRALPFDPWQLIGAGLGFALVAGTVAFAAGESFLAGLWIEIPLWGDATLEVGTPLLFEAGIYLIVVGTVLAMTFAFEEAFSSSVPRGEDKEA